MKTAPILLVTGPACLCVGRRIILHILPVRGPGIRTERGLQYTWPFLSLLVGLTDSFHLYIVNVPFYLYWIRPIWSTWLPCF